MEHEIRIKEEYRNAFGSIKDRVAWALLAEAIGSGSLGPHGHVIDASSGNYGIALASLGRMLDVQVDIVVSAGTPAATVDLIRAAGASIHVAEPVQGETLHQGRIALAGEIAAQTGATFLDQYNNPGNPNTHYRWTAAETFESFLPDAMFVSASSGGTAAGISRYVRDRKLSFPLIVVDSIASNILAKPMNEGRLLVPGMGSKRRTSFVPESGDYQLLRIPDSQALACYSLLEAGAGLSLGLSSCGVLAGALRWLSLQKQPCKVAMLGVDGRGKYSAHVAACRQNPTLAADIEAYIQTDEASLMAISGLWE
ncbi:hypothetical protein GCM10007874_72030 [Labrys miyagiensis]|uniref:Tryptophan synthase beta chain-like PALP domain-containing protein n=2 Tax=Labrys miyagiensis TaxID=346912 RepID=A0ABQ6CV07_9HYPH|nr:hypothetical protein GCM10007874_72030 [Labrys miyagiensis]